MAKLYPPIIEEIIPAFSMSTGLSIPYSLNRAVGMNEVAGFALVIKSTITNEVLYTNTINRVTENIVTFSVNSSKASLVPGGFYKIQIAFIDSFNEIGYYSNAEIVKYIGEKGPQISIQDSVDTAGAFIGIYECPEDITEKLYSYQFWIYDNDGNLIETSGEQLHNTLEDMGTTYRDTYLPKKVLDNETNCQVKYKITTINHLELITTKDITIHKDLAYGPRFMNLKASFNRENGYVNLNVYSSIQNNTKELTYGKFEIFKTSSKDNFKNKYRIAYFKLENQDLFEKSFKDLTVESGYVYQYVLQQVNDYHIYSEEIFSNKVKVNFDHIFLFDGNRQLKIAFNPQISTFKDTILETKIDTIGSKYPFFVRNEQVDYKEMSLSGLISYQLDDENLFIEDHEIWTDQTVDLDGGWVSDKSGWTHNLTDESITAERMFKLRVQEWLENGQIKLMRTPTEGNYMVRLMNVSLSPNDTVGRMLHSFQATVYEVKDVDQHNFTQALTIDRLKRYIGYRTVPLYNFPYSKMALPIGNNGQMVAISALQLYNIIINPALEYVVSAKFEDVKPGTEFEVKMERGLEEIIYTFKIGATGTHLIPRRLGFHITSIKLTKSEWDVGKIPLDMINNRGQVTYEFERQAKHNNFNDITKINSDILISAPLYPSWITAKMNANIFSEKYKTIYQKNEQIGTVQGYIRAGWFQDKNSSENAENNEPIFLVESASTDVNKAVNIATKNNNGKVIISPAYSSSNYFWQEGEKYYRKKNGNNQEIIPCENVGKKYQYGDYIYHYTLAERYELAANPNSNTYSSSKVDTFLLKLVDNFIPLEKETIEEKKGTNENDVIIRTGITTSAECYILNDFCNDYDYENGNGKNNYFNLPEWLQPITDDKYMIGMGIKSQIVRNSNKQVQYNSDKYDFQKNGQFFISTTQLQDLPTYLNIPTMPQKEDDYYIKQNGQTIIKNIPNACLYRINIDSQGNPEATSFQDYHKQIPVGVQYKYENPFYITISLNSDFEQEICEESGEDKQKKPIILDLISESFIKDNRDNIATTANSLEEDFISKIQNKIKNSTEKDFILDYSLKVPVYQQKLLKLSDLNSKFDTKIKYGEFTMYRNCVAHKYYNVQNINGEYYDKEDIENIYSLDFELIQSLYPENLENTQNFNLGNGWVEYEDVVEDSGYQYTNRYISGWQYANGDLLAVDSYKGTDAYNTFGTTNIFAVKDSEDMSAEEMSMDIFQWGQENMYDVTPQVQEDSGLKDQGNIPLDFKRRHYSNKISGSDEILNASNSGYLHFIQDTYLLSLASLITKNNDQTYIEILYHPLTKKPTSTNTETDNNTETETNNNTETETGTNTETDIDNSFIIWLIDCILNGEIEIYEKKDSKTILDSFYINKVSIDGEIGGKLQTIRNQPSLIDASNTVLQNHYLFIKEQALKNYIEATTPRDNEIIISYLSIPQIDPTNGEVSDVIGTNHLVKIDLSQRYSYHIDTEDEIYGIQNINGIYLGKNVRGFMTYKRKAYEYKALLADGASANLRDISYEKNSYGLKNS